MKVYVTKYALTKGILELEVESCEHTYQSGAVNGQGMVSYKGWGMTVYFHGEDRDWHRTFEGAVKKANEMRTAKLKSLDKQHAKIANLEFNTPIKEKP